MNKSKSLALSVPPLNISASIKYIGDDNNIKDVVKSASCNIETYGFQGDADWHIADYRFEEGYGHFSLSFKNNNRGNFKLAMMGQHNV